MTAQEKAVVREKRARRITILDAMVVIATTACAQVMQLNRKKIARVAAFSTLGIVAIVVCYLVLLCHPGVLFSHSFTRGGVTLFSDEPIPSEPAGRILEEVVRRLSSSSLGAPGRINDLRVYICNRRWRFVLFANAKYKVGGLAYPPLSDNIFLREVRFHSNRLVGNSGQEATGARTVSYYIAHEIMHTLVARELGIVKHWLLPAWKNEGYADLVAKGGDFDFERAREQLRSGDRELDPKRSGLYLRYHLLVAYLLDHKGISADELLNRDFDQAQLEAEILAPEKTLDYHRDFERETAPSSPISPPTTAATGRPNKAP
jgi:hypothetical protein